MQSSPSPRYLLIDALRGVAALGVVIFHLLNIHVLAPTLHKSFGVVADFTHYFRFERAFFVISGFVIAHSLRNFSANRREVGNFILRRQMRLDPPYWCVLVLMLAMHWAETKMPGLKSEPMPSLGAVFLNGLYLQGITRAPGLLNVAWTLCLEIQFYLFFIVLLFFSQRLNSGVRPAAWAVFLTGALSLLIAVTASPLAPGMQHPFFTHYWFYFAAGALAYWCMQEQEKANRIGIFNALWGVTIIFLVLLHRPLDDALSIEALLIGLATSLLIYHTGRSGKLLTWGSHPTLQYLGRISYSLYLIHVFVMLGVMRIGYKITGENPKAALGWLVLTTALCFAGAHLLHLCVEKPSMNLATRFKLRPGVEPTVAPVMAAPNPQTVTDG